MSTKKKLLMSPKTNLWVQSEGFRLYPIFLTYFVGIKSFYPRLPTFEIHSCAFLLRHCASEPQPCQFLLLAFDSEPQ